MKKVTVLLILSFLISSCGSVKIKESAGDEERFSRRPITEEKIIYSEFDLEEGIYNEEFIPEYNYTPEIKSEDIIIEDFKE